MTPSVLAMLLLTVTVHTVAAAPRTECRRGCAQAKKACQGLARTHKQRLRAECTPSGALRRSCLRAAAATARAEGRACVPFARACRTCCGAGGSECTARCGDGNVRATVGETCDPPGTPCAGGGTCSPECRCPPAAVTTTTVPVATTTTTTTLPASGPLGRARFAVGERTTWFGSSFVGFDLLEDSAAGALVLEATGDAGAEATLALAVDGTMGVKFLNGSYLCMQLSAAGSTGVLHCAGSAQGVDASWTIDSHGFGPSLSSVVSFGLGGPSPRGSGFLVAAMRVVSCPAIGTGGVPGCLVPLTSSADCLDPRKVSYAAPLPFAAVLTTGTSVARIANSRPDSIDGAVETLGRGEPFPCAGWRSEGGEAVLAFPLPAVDLAGVGDWTSVGLIHLVRTDR